MVQLFFAFLLSTSSFAQNLSPEEQQKLLQDMAAMKERINKLEQKSPSPGGGLKTTNYNNETTDTKSGPAPAPAQPALSAEQSQKLMEDIAAIKANQEKSKKILEELDKEEE